MSIAKPTNNKILKKGKIQRNDFEIRVYIR